MNGRKRGKKKNVQLVLKWEILPPPFPLTFLQDFISHLVGVLFLVFVPVHVNPFPLSSCLYVCLCDHFIGRRGRKEWGKEWKMGREMKYVFFSFLFPDKKTYFRWRKEREERRGKREETGWIRTRANVRGFLWSKLWEKQLEIVGDRTKIPSLVGKKRTKKEEICSDWRMNEDSRRKILRERRRRKHERKEKKKKKEKKKDELAFFLSFLGSCFSFFLFEILSIPWSTGLMKLTHFHSWFTFRSFSFLLSLFRTASVLRPFPGESYNFGLFCTTNRTLMRWKTDTEQNSRGEKEWWTGKWSNGDSMTRGGHSLSSSRSSWSFCRKTKKEKEVNHWMEGTRENCSRICPASDHMSMGAIKKGREREREPGHRSVREWVSNHSVHWPAFSHEFSHFPPFCSVLKSSMLVPRVKQTSEGLRWTQTRRGKENKKRRNWTKLC